MKTCRFTAALMVLTIGISFSSLADMGAVALQAESGRIGSSFTIADDDGVTYISNTNNNVGFLNNRPQIPGRVVTYSVTFPSAGTYELYARVRVGPGGTADDSFLYGNGFGLKSVGAAGDWIVVNGVADLGFTNPTDVVTTGGSAGANVWKWINVSQDTGTSGGTPISFVVTAGNLIQTFQIGGKEDGFDLDKFVFAKVGDSFTVADLDAAMESPPPPVAGQIYGPAKVDGGKLSIRYHGTAGHRYAQEWTDSLNPPVTWTALMTNAAASNGLMIFTNAASSFQGFYRVHDVTPIGTNPPPLVYAVENTGADFPAPPLPTLANLPVIQPLPDPFAWANDPFDLGRTRSTNFGDWSRRRAEIKAQIENYEIGLKPSVDPAMIFASYTNGTLTVVVTNIVSGMPRTLSLTCTVFLPAGDGPFPAVIGMNSPSGSIPSSLFTSRNIARITFSHNQVTTYGNPQNTNPYYLLYADLGLNVDNTGQYSAWAWGVSRIIDGLEKVQGVLPIDLKHLAVTGCSYAGKMALFSGALDERIALTIAQESGGGGATSWRYSNTEPTGTVEGLAQTDHNWFREDMFQFGGYNVSKLPEDHHLLMAMVAPRALFATGNPDYTWLSNPSCYVTCRAVERIYDTFGISDRFGFNIVGGHSHCATTDSIDAEIGAFLDKFMLGNTNADTTIRDYPDSYNSIDSARWSQWWGNVDPVFPN